jgi:putative peptide zinc metalloprotease protein
MAQLRLSYPEIQKRDTEILQVTYSTAEDAQLYFKQYQLTFPYLCDPERAVYRLYGLSMTHFGLRSALASAVAGMSDRLLRRDMGPSPAPYIKRYGFAEDLEQAVFIVDKASIIRYVYTTGPIGGLPSNAEYLCQLDKLQA